MTCAYVRRRALVVALPCVRVAIRARYGRESTRGTVEAVSGIDSSNAARTTRAAVGVLHAQDRIERPIDPAERLSVLASNTTKTSAGDKTNTSAAEDEARTLPKAIIFDTAFSLRASFSGIDVSR